MDYKTVIALVALAAAIVAGPVEAEEPEESPFVKATGGRPSPDQPAKKYTNADLARLFGSGASAEPAAADPAETAPSIPAGERPAAVEAPQNPLDAMMAQRDAERDKRVELAAAKGRLAAAERRLEGLKKRRLAVTNPFLARPALPEDQRDDWEGLKPGERLDKTDAEIRAAEEAVRNARAEVTAGGG